MREGYEGIGYAGDNYHGGNRLGGQMNAALAAAVRQTDAAGDSIRKREVEQEMSRLRQMIAEMGNMVDSLAARTEPVRSKAGPVGEKASASAPEPILCDLANQIRDMRRNLEGHLRVVTLVLDELEI